MGIGSLKNPVLRPAVFLDRDGVVNAARVDEGRPFPPQGVDQLIILDGVLSSVRDLTKTGYVCVVVTNQPDIARGTASSQAVDAINTKIAELTHLKHFYVCPHDESDACDCRKPLPGLLLQAASQLQLDLTQSFMVGDRWRDVEAGKNAGVRTFFIDYGYLERQPIGYDWRVHSLREAADIVLSQQRFKP